MCFHNREPVRIRERSPEGNGSQLPRHRIAGLIRPNTLTIRIILNYLTMNRFSTRSFCQLALVLCLFVAATEKVVAQQPKPKPTPPVVNQDDVPITTFIRRVRLPITVVDKKVQIVPGLTKNDFLVLEDRLPQQIETFYDDLGESLPLYVFVLMDTSHSTAG
jgi:hypothetical protein